MKKTELISCLLAVLMLTSCNAGINRESTEISNSVESTVATEELVTPIEPADIIVSGELTMHRLDVDYDSIRLLARTENSYYALGKNGKYYLATREAGSSEFTLLLEEGFDEIELAGEYIFCDGKCYSDGTLEEATEYEAGLLATHLAQKGMSVESKYSFDFYIDPNDMYHVYHRREDGLFEKDYYPNFYGPLYGAFRSVEEPTPLTLEDGSVAYSCTTAENNWGLMLCMDRVVLEGVYERVIDRNIVLAKQGGKYAAFRKEEDLSVTQVGDFQYDLPDYVQHGSLTTILVKDGKYGILNKSAEVLLPFEYDYVTDVHQDGNVFILSDGVWYAASLLPKKPEGEGTVFTRNEQGIIMGSGADYPLTFSLNGVSFTTADMAVGTEWILELEEMLLDDDFDESDGVINAVVAVHDGGGQTFLDAKDRYVRCGETFFQIKPFYEDFFALNGMMLTEAKREDVATVLGAPSDVTYEFYGEKEEWLYSFENGDELTLEFTGDTLVYIELEINEE